MIELQRTGFFREMSHGASGDPSLAAARHAVPMPHEDRIAAYLEAGQVYMATPGVVQDVLAAGDITVTIGAPHLVTDGRFLWPADLAYYVRTYHVRLDPAFLEHMLASGWTIPADLDLAELALPLSSALPRPAEPPPAAPDLAAVFASFLQSLNAAGVDTEQIKRSLGDASREVLRAAESIGTELRRAVETAGAQVREQLASSLRTMADRAAAAKPAQSAAEAPPAELRAAVTAIEAEMDALGEPQQRADDAERRQRLASDVRGTIAARLREHGIEPAAGPSGDSGDPDRER